MLSGCARTAASTRVIEVTGYCGCGKCNGYTRGSWKFLKLDVWHRELDYGAHKGEPYTGRTAGGGWLRTPQPGLFSVDSIKRPWMIPVRIVVIPWILPRDGTIAADTDYYAFGTRMYIDGWGWGVVDDRGGAIKGSNRLDLYHRTHGLANKWGRRNVEVKIVRKN